MSGDGTQVSIAVVMPAHRSGPHLARSVASVDALDPPADEFLIVNDGSDVGVTGQVGTFHSVLCIAQSGPAAARNAGVAATTGDVVLFVDSDIIVPTDLVGRIRSVLESDEASSNGCLPDAVFGAYDDTPDSPETVSQFRNLLHHWTHHQAAGPAHTFWAGCGAVRRTAFEAVLGFDERFEDATIEDIELGERLHEAGFTIVIEPSIEVKHLKRWTLVGMITTDIAKRGVPWSRLMLRKGSMSDDLNTTRAARMNVVLVALLALTIGGSVPRWPMRRHSMTLAPLLAAFLVWRDRGFLSYLVRCRSVAFAARSVPLLWIHHLSAGLAFGWALITEPWTDRSRP